MAHVTLIRPPTVASVHSYSVPTTPPIGLAYLAGTLEAAGHQVVVIDALGEAPLRQGETCHPLLRANGLSIPQILDRIDPATDGIGVSAMFSQEWPHTERLILALRERFPDNPIILGGEHATAAWEHVLSTCPAVTCCGLGEGEETILDFARHLEGKLPLEAISGLAIRREGAAVMTAPRRRIIALDDIPRPAWHLVPIETYLSGGFGHGVDLGRSMPLLATRGCPYQCAFCSNPTMWTTRYAMRSVSSVVDEIEDYVRLHHATNIDFYDLTAIIRRDWILDFCRALQRRRLAITWQLPSGTRSEALDAEALRWLHRTGCRNITYAPESGSPNTLRRIKKKVKLPRMCESIRAAKKAGIRLKCNLIIGFPGETRADVYRTMVFALKMALMGVDDVPLYLFSPYPGSELYREMRARGVIQAMDNDYFASLACFMDLSQSSRYCEHIGPRELNLYRIAGMAGFYGLSYLVRPWRILRTTFNVLKNRSATVFEQRLCDVRKRWSSRSVEHGTPLSPAATV